MTTIADALVYLTQIKNSIRDAIRSKGIYVAGDVPFKDFAEKIKLIEGGAAGGSGGFDVVENVTIKYVGTPTFEHTELASLESLTAPLIEDSIHIAFYDVQYFVNGETGKMPEDTLNAAETVVIEYIEV